VNNMTEQQVAWAKLHSWFYSVDTLPVTGTIFIWCHSKRPEGGLVPFKCIDMLKQWAASP
jgi:hypothetical protein